KIVMAIAERGLFEPSFPYTRVENCGRAVVVDGAAGKAAVGVGPTGSGCERDGHVPPVNHVFADGVIPVHVAPDGGVRVVLEKHVVEAVPVNGAVRIVHPVLGGEKMELRAKWIGGELGLEGVVWKKVGSSEREGRQCGERCGGGGFEKAAA